MTDPGYGSQQNSHSQAADDTAYQQEQVAHHGTGMSRQGSTQNESPSFFLHQNPFDALAGVGEGTGTDQYAVSRDPASRTYGPSYGDHGLDILNQAAQLASPLAKPMLEPPAEPPNNVFFGHANQYSEENLHRSFDHSVMDEKATKPQLTSGPFDPQSNLSAVRNESGQYICKVCGKPKKRECDLRYDSPSGRCDMSL